MHFSRPLKSSVQSIPSPNGAHIATIFPSKLSIRETRTLNITRVISLPPELSSSISWFMWSPSSARILVGSADNIRVYSTTNAQFSANITNPTSGTTKVVSVSFGATDDEICIFSEFGLKLSIIGLRTSKSVEINTPKFYSPATAGKGCTSRPVTHNLALLSRYNGKDVISIHARDTFEVTRSWHPDTVDAQGLSWSPDGRWLVVLESASQGHKAAVYTADGHLFKSWNGPAQVLDEVDFTLGAGVRIYDWSKTGAHFATGDYSKKVTILSAPAFSQAMSLVHTSAITPADTLQIWQEQVNPSQAGSFVREFVAANQTILPPTSGTSTNNNVESKSSTNILSFDNSGALLVSRTEDMPTTLWIWDVSTRVLRTVIIFHSPIAKATWHPSVNELLLVRCEGDENRSLVHLWDPSWSNPRVIDFAPQFVGGKVIGKTVARWLNTDSASPAIFFSDSQDCVLASLAVEQIEDEKDETLPWADAQTRGVDIYGQREESPLSLVPADEKYDRSRMDLDDEGFTSMSAGSEEVDDTFKFKKFVS